jgi:17beta-estradiol 17-dehydrogenase / very-long-chain 3-oxoacyl-CoA reductase
MCSIWEHFLSRPLDLNPYINSWTVVTGGTDGIGRAYIEELARTREIRKFYIIGRNPIKLSKVQSELVERYKCEVRTAIFDFETDNLEKLPEELGILDVGILVNCVEIRPDKIGTFSEQPDDLASKLVKINFLSYIKMLEMLLPGMVQRNIGIIVNISSILGKVRV